jgi:hypothetical protein
MTLVYALPIDIKMEGKVKVEQVVVKRKTELLVMIVSLFVFTRRSWETITFPASLATYARIAFGPSCFALCVSSSKPSHMIAKSRGCRFNGMGCHV